tara:strand:- start:577 stop:1170 length:594 start_codon:yes stop_codon:yes gene_type:complete
MMVEELQKNAEYYKYDSQKKYTFKNDEIRADYESLSNIDRLVTRIFVESVADWSTKKIDILESNDVECKLLEAIAPCLSKFEHFYPIPVGVDNMQISSTVDPSYQSRLIRNSFNAKGYGGILIIDQLDTNQNFKFKMPYGNFFSSSADIVVDVRNLHEGELNAGDLILYPKHLTVFFPPLMLGQKQRFFEFNIVGHD